MEECLTLTMSLKRLIASSVSTRMKPNDGNLNPTPLWTHDTAEFSFILIIFNHFVDSGQKPSGVFLEFCPDQISKLFMS